MTVAVANDNIGAAVATAMGSNQYTLTFTTNTLQTVTVSAGADADKRDGSARLTYKVSSGDSRYYELEGDDETAWLVWRWRIRTTPGRSCRDRRDSIY